MTIEELTAALGTRKIARHHGSCFFSTGDPDVAEEWSKRGADVRTAVIWGNFTAEVHLAPLLDPMWEDDGEGGEMDARPAFLLNYFRERDGYDVPRLSAWTGGGA